MIIVVPVDENKENVCVSFGRAPYFMVTDSSTNEVKLVENEAAAAEGGAGIQAAQQVVDLEADVLITVRCGENAGKVFNASGIEVYKSQGSSAKDNIAAYQEGKLGKLDHFHAGFHGKQ